jgi:hypothetical protein
VGIGPDFPEASTGSLVAAWELEGFSRLLEPVTGGRLIRHARYLFSQLDESRLTQRLFEQILWRIERLAEHPT